MKVHLLYRDRDLDGEQALPSNADALAQDLDLNTLLDVMGQSDAFLRTVAERVLLLGLESQAEVGYRTEVLADCLDHPELVRRLYELAVEAVEAKQKLRFFWFNDSPDTQRQKSLRMLELLAEVMRGLRALADEHVAALESEGFTNLFMMLRRELDDDYLALVDAHLKALQFKDGVLTTSELGRGNRGSNYVLRRSERGLLGRFAPDWASGMSFLVPTRDEHAGRALGELRDRSIAVVANALAQSTDHILSFFQALRTEVGFYVACLNLREQLAERDLPVCLPETAPSDERALSARGLYDASLALHLGTGVVGNDLDADGKQLVLVTGANEGGKSTFLRSVGLAQLMLQAGMFVPGEAFRASVCSGVFTHFKREEDASMTSGKLDEELQRMSEIADQIGSHGLLLCNESLASTNEAEGSEIARQVIRALVEENIRVVYVTHMFDLAHGFQRQQSGTTLFLRAERCANGERTFRVIPGDPEPTSYGLDSYRRIFGREPARLARGESVTGSEVG